MDKNSRIVAIDVARIVACCLLISLHFFLHTGFYEAVVTGWKMLLLIGIRVVASCCIPLFLLISGYLLREKTLNKRYYHGIIRILILYTLAGILSLLWRVYYQHESFSLTGALSSLVGFSASRYAWYVEMYIGLFLMIPFLNILYRNLPGKRTKYVLIATCLVLTALPDVLNSFNFSTPGWWAQPSISMGFVKLIPNYWVACYPVTYYFIGCFISEYRPNIKTLPNLALFLLLVVLNGLFQYYRFYGDIFNLTVTVQSESSLFTGMVSVSLFLLLANLKLDGLSQRSRDFLARLSNLTFCAYLLSYIVDTTLYPLFNGRITETAYSVRAFLVMVPLVSVCSFALSFLVQLLYDGGARLLLLLRRRGDGAER